MESTRAMTRERESRAESKNCEILCFRPLTDVLTRKSNAPPGRPHFGSNSPLYWAECKSNVWGLPGGGDGRSGIDWYINYVYHNLPFPQNLNHWLLEKSEMINLDLDADFKKYIQCFKFKLSFWKNVLRNVCLGFFAADAILAHVKAWGLVLWKCPRRSMTLRSASTFYMYTSTERLTRLKLLKCVVT